MLDIITSYFLVTNFLELTMQKENLEIFIVLTPSLSNIIIFQFVSDIVIFFSYVISNMSSLNLYGYNSNEIGATYKNVGFLFNLEQISRSSKHSLGI